MTAALKVVSSASAPPAPYPPDTRAKGWRFELDHERIDQSDTWVLADAAMRPWLLMLWLTAWRQTPCGSLPAHDELIAARIGMDRRMFTAHRDILMRGWWLASDGRFYHPVITEQVHALISLRTKNAGRVQRHRENKTNQRLADECNALHMRDSRITTPLVTTPEPEPEPEPDTSTSLRSVDSAGTTEQPAKAKRQPKSKEPKPKPSRICPSEWAPSAELIEDLKAEHPTLDIARQEAAMRLHEFKAPGYTDWGRVLRRWCARAEGFAQQQGGSQRQQYEPTPYQKRMRDLGDMIDRGKEAARRMQEDPSEILAYQAQIEANRKANR